MNIKAMVLAGGLAAVMSLPAIGGKIDTGAVIGGAIGGGVGAAVGSKIGGTGGAAIGGAIGGGLGAAVGSDGKPGGQVAEHEVHDDDRPPGHGHGRKKGWKKHHDHGHDD